MKSRIVSSWISSLALCLFFNSESIQAANGELRHSSPDGRVWQIKEDGQKGCFKALTKVSFRSVAQEMIQLHSKQLLFSGSGKRLDYKIKSALFERLNQYSDESGPIRFAGTTIYTLDSRRPISIQNKNEDNKRITHPFHNARAPIPSNLPLVEVHYWDSLYESKVPIAKELADQLIRLSSNPLIHAPEKLHRYVFVYDALTSKSIVNSSHQSVMRKVAHRLSLEPKWTVVKGLKNLSREKLMDVTTSGVDIALHSGANVYFDFPKPGVHYRLIKSSVELSSLKGIPSKGFRWAVNHKNWLHIWVSKYFVRNSGMLVAPVALTLKYCFKNTRREALPKESSSSVGF